MKRHLQRNLDDIKKKLLEMGGLVEGAIHYSLVSLKEKKLDMAQMVMEGDDAIDKIEVEIEEDCLKALALYSPVAEDLRFVASVMKINSDLERMGDLAVNTAKRVKKLCQHDPGVNIPPEFEQMGQHVIHMSRESLKAFVHGNSQKAREICIYDDQVDALHKKCINELGEQMSRSQIQVKSFIDLLWASRNIERIADHATNIAEDVVYMVEGDIIRHTDWEPDS